MNETHIMVTLRTLKGGGHLLESIVTCPVEQFNSVPGSREPIKNITCLHLMDSVHPDGLESWLLDGLGCNLKGLMLRVFSFTAMKH